MMAVLTHRDLDILETLTRRLRLLAIAQVQRVWWPTHMSCRVARRRMRQLAVAGLVCRTIVNAHPLLPVEGPLGVWQPGDGEPEDREPNAHRISRQDRDRWRQSSGPIEVFTATRRTANLFGSTAGRLPPMLHRDHDLLLAQVFTFYRTFDRKRPAVVSAKMPYPRPAIGSKIPMRSWSASVAGQAVSSNRLGVMHRLRSPVFMRTASSTTWHMNSGESGKALTTPFDIPRTSRRTAPCPENYAIAHQVAIKP